MSRPVTPCRSEITEDSFSAADSSSFSARCFFSCSPHLDDAVLCGGGFMGRTATCATAQLAQSSLRCPTSLAHSVSNPRPTCHRIYEKVKVRAVEYYMSQIRISSTGKRIPQNEPTFYGQLQTKRLWHAIETEPGVDSLTCICLSHGTRDY
jgi:hypothetical protein